MQQKIYTECTIQNSALHLWRTTIKTSAPLWYSLPILPRDTCVKLILSDRPVLRSAALKLWMCKCGVFMSRTSVHSRNFLHIEIFSYCNTDQNIANPRTKFMKKRWKLIQTYIFTIQYSDTKRKALPSEYHFLFTGVHWIIIRCCGATERREKYDIWTRWAGYCSGNTQ